MPQVCGVYTITNTLNGKVYVGSSVDVARRFSKHRCLLNRGVHNSRHLQKAWVRYGEAVFVFAVVEVTGRDQRLTREQVWIGATRCCERDFGYNIAPIAGASMQGRKHTEAAREKIAASKRGKKRPPFSDEWCRKLSSNFKGRRHTAETKLRMSAWQVGRVMSVVAREKMSVSAKARWAQGRGVAHV